MKPKNSGLFGGHWGGLRRCALYSKQIQEAQWFWYHVRFSKWFFGAELEYQKKFGWFHLSTSQNTRHKLTNIAAVIRRRCVLMVGTYSGHWTTSATAYELLKSYGHASSLQSTRTKHLQWRKTYPCADNDPLSFTSLPVQTWKSYQNPIQDNTDLNLQSGGVSKEHQISLPTATKEYPSPSGAASQECRPANSITWAVAVHILMTVHVF